MKNTSFGLPSIGKETPKFIKNIRDSLIYLIAGLLAFTPLMTRWFHMSGDDFAMYNGFAIFIIRAIARMFGVNDEDKEVKPE